MQELLGIIGQVRTNNTIDMTITTRTLPFACFKSKQQMTILRLLNPGGRLFNMRGEGGGEGGRQLTFRFSASIHQKTKKDFLSKIWD